MQNTKFSLLGIPLDLGAENLGVDVGPDAFRSLKIVEKLERAGLTIEDVGNVECRPRQGLTVGDSKLRYLDEIVRVSEESAKLVAEHVKQGDKVIALGGDHSVCLGTISGAAAALGERLGLVYIDAHGDINTTETTLTGNIHGMPLASLMGFGDERLQNVLTKTRKISPENLLHIGGNDFDPGEIEMVKREHLNCFMTFDMLADGLRALFKMIDDLSARADHVWVSLDLDAIDEIYAPGVGMPNKGGLTYREIVAIVSYISQKMNVVGMDLVEYNPLADDNAKTAELGIELIARTFGSNYSWYTNYMEQNKI